MAPNIDQVADMQRQQRRVVASTLSDLSDELDILLPEDLDLAIEAFEAAFRPSSSASSSSLRSRSSVFRSAASMDHGLTARCPALEDLIGAVDASGEDECEASGIFTKRKRNYNTESKGHRQFPCASLNTQ